jgi:hypothetical protein
MLETSNDTHPRADQGVDHAERRRRRTDTPRPRLGCDASPDHGVSPEYIRALNQLGYKPSLDDLVKARDHGISPEYLNELRDLGLAGLSLETMIRARDHGISPEYVRDLAQLGYRPSLDGLIRARDLHEDTATAGPRCRARPFERMAATISRCRSC